MSTSDPCACLLDPGALERRVAEWRTVANAGLLTREAVPEGVRLAFKPEPSITHALLDLVDAERACCNFAQWTVTATEEETVVVAATQGDGVAVIQGLFEVAS